MDRREAKEIVDWVIAEIYKNRFSYVTDGRLDLSKSHIGTISGTQTYGGPIAAGAIWDRHVQLNADIAGTKIRQATTSERGTVELAEDGEAVSGLVVQGDDTRLMGKVFPLANTYVSGTGTAGSDNTAQTVKTVVIPANTLTQINDRIRIRVWWRGDTGAGITATVTVNGVTIASATDAGAADLFATESWIHYIDATHANIIENGTYPATGPASALNMAGFDWTIAMDVDVDQDAIPGNHIVVAAIFLDVLPLGVV